MGGGAKDSPTSSSSSSGSSKVRLKKPLIDCAMCEQGNHEPKVCPWIYSRCKHVPCNGVRAFLRSTTTENYGKMFLKCTIPTCTYFEWFEDACNPCKPKILVLPSLNSCYACGEDDHLMKNCPLRNQACFKSTCKSLLKLDVCNNEYNKHIAYLICSECKAFTWASDAIFIAAKDRVRNSRVQVASLTTNV